MADTKGALTASELDQAITAAKQLDEEAGGDHEFIVRVLGHTGLRVSEFCHMTGDWVSTTRDRDAEPEIHVQVPEHEPCECSTCRQHARESEGRTIDDYWMPKSPAAHEDRDIPVLEHNTVRVMKRYFSEQEGVEMSRQTVWRRLNEVEDRAGLDSLTAHRLRRTFGSLVAYRMDEWNPFHLKQVMGHADISSSQDYIKYTPDQLAERQRGVF